MSSNTATCLSLYSLNALAKLDLAKQTCASDNLVLAVTDQRFELDKPHNPTPPPRGPSILNVRLYRMITFAQ